MLRNQDRPELVLFVGAKAYASEDGTPRPGAARLCAEAKAAGTPSVWLVEDGGDAAAAAAEGPLAATPWPPSAPRAPCPLALQLVRESVAIVPDSYGGSDGFGRGRQMPERAPLAGRCVVVAGDRDSCVAGRSAGMRVVGLVGDEDLDDASDVSFYELEDEWEVVTFDDLYTPGSYWVNPPTPRSVDGLHVDPNTGTVVEYDAFQAIDVAAVSDAEQRILDDLAPLDDYE